MGFFDFFGKKKDDKAISVPAGNQTGMPGNTDRIASLVRELGNKDGSARKAAAEELSRLGQPEWARWVRGKENDIECLGLTGDSRTIEPLLAAWQSQTYPYSNHAALALNMLGDKQVMQRMVDNKFTDATWAKLILLEDRAAVKELIGMFAYPSHVEAAAVALGRIGDASALVPLIKLLDHEKPDVKSAAATALGKLGGSGAVEPLLRVIQAEIDDGAGWTKVAAARSLRSLGDNQAFELLAGVVDRMSDKKEWLSESVVQALGALGDPRGFEILAGLLNTESGYGKDVRRSAAQALGELGDSRAMPLLIVALSDSHYDVVKDAAKALSELGDTGALKSLIDAYLLQFSEDGHWSTAESIAKAFAKLGDKRAIDPLRQAFDSTERIYCWEAAAAALADLGDKSLVEKTRGYLDDADPEIRKCAVRSFGRLTDQSDRDVLMKIYLDDPDEKVRFSAKFALIGLLPNGCYS